MADAARGLRYVETPPGADAQPVVAAYWGFDVYELPTSSFVHRVWPHGCVTLAFVCDGDTLAAARVHAGMREPYDVSLRVGVRTRGIRFRPECGAAFLDIAPALVCDRNIDAREVLGDEACMLAFDATTNRYTFFSASGSGQAQQFAAEPTGDDGVIWTILGPNGHHTRYTITRTPAGECMRSGIRPAMVARHGRACTR